MSMMTISCNGAATVAVACRFRVAGSERLTILVIALVAKPTGCNHILFSTETLTAVDTLVGCLVGCFVLSHYNSYNYFLYWH